MKLWMLIVAATAVFAFAAASPAQPDAGSRQRPGDRPAPSAENRDGQDELMQQVRDSNLPPQAKRRIMQALMAQRSQIQRDQPNAMGQGPMAQGRSFRGQAQADQTPNFRGQNFGGPSFQGPDLRGRGRGQGQGLWRDQPPQADRQGMNFDRPQRGMRGGDQQADRPQRGMRGGDQQVDRPQRGMRGGDQQVDQPQRGMRGGDQQTDQPANVRGQALERRIDQLQREVEELKQLLSRREGGGRDYRRGE